MMPIDLCDQCESAEFIRQLTIIGDRIRESHIIVYKIVCPIIIFTCFFSGFYNMMLVGISKEGKKDYKRTVLLLSLRLAFTDSIVAFLNGFNNLFLSYLPVVHRDASWYMDYQLNPCTVKVLEMIRSSAIAASAYHLLALAIAHHHVVANPFEAR